MRFGSGKGHDVPYNIRNVLGFGIFEYQTSIRAYGMLEIQWYRRRIIAR